MFPNVIQTLNLDMKILKEELLSLEDFDFTLTSKKVITKVCKEEVFNVYTFDAFNQ